MAIPWRKSGSYIIAFNCVVIIYIISLYRYNDRSGIELLGEWGHFEGANFNDAGFEGVVVAK